MNQPPKDAKAIFLEAIESFSPQQWDVYLKGACRGDAALFQQVKALLKSHQADDSLFDRAAITDNFSPQITERPGTEIGAYKLLQQIGEGGFGVVYMAEQLRPVKRKVALKIIKPGMDTKEVIARFEAERQSLALMEHPNIAKVFDGGATVTGRPYFVMELVKGVPITEFCDNNCLSTQQRLEMFGQVCKAIQHAHQKGVIHRDIKPSNVMVTLHDGKPVPKVIDFGVAKAISQRLTEKTMFTAYGQMIGTPQYMSPEQAEMSGLDVDTRTDIYSLGVLLYELLTGTTPLQAKELRETAYAELRRLICETEPPKPSTRISTLGDQSAVIAKQRGTEPRKLGLLLRGDLDWIVMKALDKDRNRRYETADRLAADIDRYLRDDIVEARAPSAGYRFRKFFHRNRALVSTIAVVIVALSIGLVLATWGLYQAQSEAVRANHEAQRASDLANELKGLLENYREELTDKALLYAFSGDLENVSEAAAQLENVTSRLNPGQFRGRVEALKGMAEYFRGNSRRAEAYCREALQAEPSLVVAKALLALSYSLSDRSDEYLALIEEVNAQQLLSEPEAFERLFIAYANMPSDCIRSEEQLKAVVQDRPTWAIARGMLAEVLAHKAIRYHDRDAIQEALRESKDANRLAPNMPFLRLGDLWVLLNALVLQDEGTSEFQSLKAEADALADALENDTDYLIGQVVRCWYLMLYGAREAAIDSCSEVIKNGVYIWAPSAFLYRCDQGPVAQSKLAMLGDENGPAWEMRTLGLLATSDELPLNVTRAISRWSTKEATTDNRIGLLEILALAGELDLAKEEARHLRATRPLSNGDWFQFGQAVDLYLAENVDDYSAYVDEKSGRRKDLESNLSYRAAVILLARGRRSEAKAFFSRAIATRMYFASSYQWSHVFLRKLDEDAAWPRWIP